MSTSRRGHKGVAERMVTERLPIPVVNGTPFATRSVGRVAVVVANVVGLGAFLWPFLLPSLTSRAEPHGTDAAWILLVLLACLAFALFSQLGTVALGPKTVALIGVLGAAMVALRLPGFVAGFSAMFIVVILAGNSFGPAFGFLLGAVGTFASGLFVGGLGPWLPFQMIAVGWVGAGAGLMPRRSSWPLRIGALALYGAFVAFAFGALMNLWFWPFAAGSSAVGLAPGAGLSENLAHYGRFYLVTSLGWDVFGAIGNPLLVIVLGRPVLGTLDRAARRMHLSRSTS